MYIRNKYFLMLGLVVALSFIATGTAMAQSKVGFVNTQRLLEETKVGRSAQEDLSKLGKEKDRQISKSAKKINELKKNLSVNPSSTLQSKLDTLYATHDELVKSSNEEIRYEEARLIQFILRHADKSLRSVAKELGFSMVLMDPNIFGYIDSSVDLTNLIIKEMNRN